ncbi:MAG: terpene cyclase/mutase family protein [Pirellulales bacterium]|nr:terpene cyclase/mutase family protein [Pirellulales bacterium]
MGPSATISSIAHLARLILCWSAATGAVAQTVAAPPLAVQGPKPVPIGSADPNKVRAAIARGVEFLLDTQLKQGAWGKSANSKYYRIWAPVPGAHRAFRTAVTGLCVSSLLESRAQFTGPRRQRIDAAIDQGQVWLLDQGEQLRRSAPDKLDDEYGNALYNIWGHSFAIQALVQLHDRAMGDEALQNRLRASVEKHIDRLRRCTFLNGGWGYYDNPPADRMGRPNRPRRAKMTRPAGSSSCFCTATALIAIHKATQLGVEFPQQRINEAVAAIERQRYPDFAYAYGEYLKMRPRYGINRPAGSLGRSQVCNLAMRLYGDEQVTDEVLATWLNRLYARNGWLSISRKRHIPGESPHFGDFGVAGYFFYYGHFYAAMCIEELPESERPYFQDYLAHILIPLQEKDGSWWDYILYDYHQQYGTAMAISALVRCQHATTTAAE